MVLIVLAIGSVIQAQDIYLDASTHMRTIYTDGASFYDSGRDGERYSNFEDLSTTICATDNKMLNVEFFKFNLEEGKDLLYISHGSGSDFTPMAGSPYTGEALKGKIISSSEGCITFNMRTDFNVMRSGWDAEVRTIEPISAANN